MTTYNTPLEYMTTQPRRFEQLRERVRSSLTAAGLTSADLLATIPEARNRVYAHRYGKKHPASVLRRRSHRSSHSH